MECLDGESPQGYRIPREAEAPRPPTVLLVVDCERNTPEDIKAGGAPVLGFDFPVPYEHASTYERAIRGALKQHGRPVMNVHHVPAEPGTGAWTMKRIREVIREGY